MSRGLSATAEFLVLVCLFIVATFCLLLYYFGMCSVFWLFWVKLSVLAKLLARKTPLRKPNRAEGIISTKPRQNGVYDFLGVLSYIL